MKKVTQKECLEWLEQNHPDLLDCAEIDRSWVWLVVDLRGAHNDAKRESIGKRGFGFRYAPKGHPLPSGKTGTWGHACVSPIPFFRRGGKGRGSAPAPANGEAPQQVEQVDQSALDARIEAMLAAL